uniref:Uncharacterized protein n=1 Tax=Timema bartmani TaxID=61472 RepID=A0A7R9F4K6_9NEOP|nr:unnamed protein product [Timema bartmani]
MPHEIVYPAGCRAVTDDLGPDELIRRLKTKFKIEKTSTTPRHAPSDDISRAMEIMYDFMEESEDGQKPAMAHITKALEDFSGITFFTSEQHVDAQKTRVKTDNIDITELYLPDQYKYRKIVVVFDEYDDPNNIKTSEHQHRYKHFAPQFRIDETTPIYGNQKRLLSNSQN